MNEHDVERMIRDYIKNNLQIDVKECSDYGYAGETDKSIRIKLILDGEPISEDYFSVR